MTNHYQGINIWQVISKASIFLNSKHHSQCTVRLLAIKEWQFCHFGVHSAPSIPRINVFWGGWSHGIKQSCTKLICFYRHICIECYLKTFFAINKLSSKYCISLYKRGCTLKERNSRGCEIEEIIFRDVGIIRFDQGFTSLEGFGRDWFSSFVWKARFGENIFENFSDSFDFRVFHAISPSMRRKSAMFSFAQMALVRTLLTM